MVAPGDYRVLIAPMGDTTIVVYDASVTLEAGVDWVFAAALNPSISPDTVDDQSPVALFAANQFTSTVIFADDDGSNVRVVHDAPNTGAVDVLAQAEGKDSVTCVKNRCEK